MSVYEGPDTYYPSKRDRWLEALVWLTSLAILVAAWRVAAEPGSPLQRLLAMLGLGGALGLVLWPFYTTGYRLTGQELIARAGPFRWRVPLAAIEEVTRSRSLLSGPACSLDRLHVRHSGQRLGLLISPADREGFLRELRLRCPQLAEQGDRLTAGGS